MDRIIGGTGRYTVFNVIEGKIETYNKVACIYGVKEIRK